MQVTLVIHGPWGGFHQDTEMAMGDEPLTNLGTKPWGIDSSARHQAFEKSLSWRVGKKARFLGAQVSMGQNQKWVLAVICTAEFAFPRFWGVSSFHIVLKVSLTEREDFSRQLGLLYMNVFVGGDI